MEIEIAVVVHKSGRWAASGTSKDWDNNYDDCMDLLGYPDPADVACHLIKTEVPEFTMIQSVIEAKAEPSEMDEEIRKTIEEDFGYGGT
jgi:hypothetical protein